MKKYTILCLSIFMATTLAAQSITKRVLFLGNSYTYVNDLPKMIADMAASMGDSFVFDSNTPGGYTLREHSTNATSLNKIKSGNLDFVVLQEQSQYPSFPVDEVETWVFPYAHILDSVIHANNPCGETVFYMTWGRKNGDSSNCAAWPPVCTYKGMDSLLNLRYRMMADSNHALLSPVGAVWKYLRKNYPQLELYQADESHPSVAGTYAAACCFYCVLFRKDPSAVTFNSTLSATDAANIRMAAKALVSDSLLNWNVGKHDPVAGFSHILSGTNQISFTNQSSNAKDYIWNFGDGDTSTSINPIHTYASASLFKVSLVATRCDMNDTVIQNISSTNTGMQSLGEKTLDIKIYPNPVTDFIYLNQPVNGQLIFKIYNMLGTQLMSGVINSSSSKIDVSAMTKDVYILVITEESGRIWRDRFVNTGR